MDETLALSISRDELSLSDLQLNTAPYGVLEFKVGAVTKIHRTAGSPFVHYEAHIGRPTRAQNRGRAVIEVEGATPAALQAAVDVVIAAFDQDTFVIIRDLDGVVEAWSCRSADIIVGWDDNDYWATRFVPVTLSFPFRPTEVPV